MSDLRNNILSIVDIQTEAVDVPEWGGMTVYVKGLTAAQRDSFEAASIRQQGKKREVNMVNLRARLLVRTIVDEHGDRIFDDSDERALGDKSASALNRLFDVASRLSGLSDADVDDLAGNSEADQS